MLLYHKDGAQAVNHGGVRYEAEADGGFNLPEPFASQLHSFPGWETLAEREQRRVREDLAKRRDPASQFDELAALRAEMRAAATPAPSRDEEIAELRKRLAALEGTDAADPAQPTEPGEAEGSGEADPGAGEAATQQPAAKPAASKSRARRPATPAK